MSLRVEDFHYHLPEELIASQPLPNRDASRMMVVHRASGKIEHRMFREFPEFLQLDDLAVLNNSRVIRARLLGENGRSEVFLAEPLGNNRWVCLVRPGKHWPLGASRSVAGTIARVESILPDGERILAFESPPDLEKYGSIPLPPYIRRTPLPDDEERYQSVFAESDGSVAAPTAGLHFTQPILEKIPHCFITLHVGLGTFRSIKTETIEEHRMHSENYHISAVAASAMNQAKRIIAVGTTAMRVLESQPEGMIKACDDRTDIFIYPSYRFRRVEVLLTNFHLPDSTLILLVSAFLGKDFTMAAYQEAVRERYRFFSYGDCMLILP